jgi:hypothetical protein
VSFNVDARYSADCLQQSQPAAPEFVSSGFGADGSPSFIVRDVRGKELRRVTADKTTLARERPRGLFSAVARLWGQR